MVLNNSLQVPGYGVNNIKDFGVWLDIQNQINISNNELLKATINDWDDEVVKEGVILDERKRICKVAWINDYKLMEGLMELVRVYNENYSNWNVDITALEDLQYTVYDSKGSHYDWHVDKMPIPTPYNTSDSGSQDSLIRKISFTIFLNDPNEYEGGELDIEVRGPTSDKRYDTFKHPEGTIVVFPSSKWHRVRPVTSGVRKSLVGWVLGPPYR